jgi:hypothetical protein
VVDHLPMVAFAFDAARAAAAGSRELADALDSLLELRAAGADQLAGVWRGRLHDQTFAAEADRLRQQGADLRESLLRTAASIDRACDDAAAENMRRRAINHQRDLEEQHRRATRLAES